MLKSNAVSSRTLSLSAIHARTVAACFTLSILLKNEQTSHTHSPSLRLYFSCAGDWEHIRQLPVHVDERIHRTVRELLSTLAMVTI